MEGGRSGGSKQAQEGGGQERDRQERDRQQESSHGTTGRLEAVTCKGIFDLRLSQQQEGVRGRESYVKHSEQGKKTKAKFKFFSAGFFSRPPGNRLPAGFFPPGLEYPCFYFEESAPFCVRFSCIVSVKQKGSWCLWSYDPFSCKFHGTCNLLTIEKRYVPFLMKNEQMN